MDRLLVPDLSSGRLAYFPFLKPNRLVSWIPALFFDQARDRPDSPMRIEHISIWCRDLEAQRKFYVSCFGCESGPRYENATKGFISYFLKFESGGRLELMRSEQVEAARPNGTIGLAHFALAVGTEAAVRAMTDILRARGVSVLSEPRWTGDGYYESVVSDPEGNVIEITV